MLLNQVLMFALPALGTCIADPLMSLVDTTFIARFSDIHALAALAPCTLAFNLINNLFSAYSAALTTSVSKLFAANKTQQAYDELKQALIVGVCGGVLTCGFGNFFSQQIIQITGANQMLVPAAIGYLKIRLFACPAVFCTMVANSFLYAQYDTFTALKLVVLNLFLNVFGDFFLVARLGWGLRGAAYATVGAQFIGLVFVLFVLYIGYQKTNLNVHNNVVLNEKKQENDTASQGALLSVMYLIKLFCYQLLHFCANGLPIIMVAAHQIIFSLFTFFSFIPTPLQQTALVFIPQQKTKSQLNQLIVFMLKLGSYLGIILSFFSISFCFLSMQFMTSDATVRNFIFLGAIQSTLALAVSCVDSVCEAVLIVMKQSIYLLRAMIFTLICLYCFLNFWGNQNLFYIWWGFFLFFVVRLVQSFWRVNEILYEDESLIG